MQQSIEEMKAWIDSASYESLLQRWRFSPVGSPWFQGEIGLHYATIMAEKSKKTPVGERVRASKSIG